MQIGGAMSYPVPAANLLPARFLATNISPDVSPDITRATQAPISAAQPLTDEQSASAREEADKPADASAKPGTGKSREGDPSLQQQRLEQLEIARLVSRDQEVRTHEQAHAAVGGRYTGAPSYTYERGPDGKRYAVGGEVGIDASPIPNDPEATLRKMEVVIRAALAPAEPSAQDRQVAAQAQAQMAEARAELAQLQRSDAQAATAERAEQRNQEKQAPAAEENSTAPVRQDLPPPPSLDLYKQLSGLQAPALVVDLVA